MNQDVNFLCFTRFFSAKVRTVPTKTILAICLVVPLFNNGCVKQERSDIPPDSLAISILEVRSDIFDTRSKLDLSHYGDLDWMGFSSDGTYARKKGASLIRGVEAITSGDVVELATKFLPDFTIYSHNLRYMDPSLDRSKYPYFHRKMVQKVVTSFYVARKEAIRDGFNPEDFEFIDSEEYSPGVTVVGETMPKTFNVRLESEGEVFLFRVYSSRKTILVNANKEKIGEKIHLYGEVLYVKKQQD